MLCSWAEYSALEEQGQIAFDLIMNSVVKTKEKGWRSPIFWNQKAQNRNNMGAEPLENLFLIRLGGWMQSERPLKAMPSGELCYLEPHCLIIIHALVNILMLSGKRWMGLCELFMNLYTLVTIMHLCPKR